MTERKSSRSRRTQGERRETTIAKLVDATIESLLQVGYARTTVKEICARAGVSHGGLFRHFRSVPELMMAAADEVATRQLENAEAGLKRIEGLPDEDALLPALKQLRETCRAPINAVFYELIVAARTDPVLQEAVQKFSWRYAQAVTEAVFRSPILASIPQGQRLVLLTTVIYLFDSEALTRSIFLIPELEKQRMELLVRMIKNLETSSKVDLAESSEAR